MESLGKSQVEEKFEIIFSNCLLVAVLHATLAVCRGIKMRLTPSLGYDNIV